MYTLDSYRKQWFGLTENIKQLELERRDCATDAFNHAQELRRLNGTELDRFCELERTFREQTSRIAELLDARKEVADDITRWYSDGKEIDWSADTTGKTAIILAEPELEYLSGICPAYAEDGQLLSKDPYRGTDADKKWTVRQKDYALSAFVYIASRGDVVMKPTDFADVLAKLKNTQRDRREQTLGASSALKYYWQVFMKDQQRSIK